MTTVLVTGATDGLGRSAAAELARWGASVLVHGRSRERGERAVAEIRAKTGNDRVAFHLADLADLRQVSALADEIEQAHPELHVLINDAGSGSCRGCETASRPGSSTWPRAARSCTRSSSPSAFPRTRSPSTVFTRAPTCRRRSCSKRSAGRWTASRRAPPEEQETAANPQAYDPEARRALWELSEHMPSVLR